MLDGPREVPMVTMVTNPYGVHYPAHTDDHPTYTVNASLACEARTDGGDHACACVYRKTRCNGDEHLCMCGDTWHSPCRCNTHEKKESAMSDKQVPVRVTTTVEVDGKRETSVVFVQTVSNDPYSRESTFGTIRAMIRYTADSAAEPYPAAASPYSDDLFAAQKPEPKRPCCSVHAVKPGACEDNETDW